MIDIDTLLKNANVSRKSCYTPADVCRILNISSSTFGRLCDQWEPPNIRGGGNGIECYRVGTHRRVPHHALLNFLQRAHNYEALHE